MKALNMHDRQSPISVPSNVAMCPICGAPIVVADITEWESETGKPVGISVECTTEPDIDSDEWEDWHKGHYSMPYVDWLPVENRVLTWFQAQYKCI